MAFCFAIFPKSECDIKVEIISGCCENKHELLLTIAFLLFLARLVYGKKEKFLVLVAKFLRKSLGEGNWKTVIEMGSI